MSRPSSSFTTPRTKSEIEVVQYITGREVVDLESFQASLAKSVNGNTGEVMLDAESVYRRKLRKLIDIVVVSVTPEGGEKITDREAIWNHILDLPQLDYNLTMVKVDNATNDSAHLNEDEKKA